MDAAQGEGSSLRGRGNRGAGKQSDRDGLPRGCFTRANERLARNDGGREQVRVCS
ncbi:MAG: hypothetical protein LBT00_12170 [Spirochaetaceae bacterium]|nr:hypothetical protein [Spirochaetaceae bacterium]